MSDETKKLQLIIEAHNKASAALKELASDLDKVHTETQKTKEETESVNKQFEILTTESKRANQQLNEIGRGEFSKLFSANFLANEMMKVQSFITSLPGKIMESAKAVADVDDNAKKLGLSAEEFQRWEHAAKFADSSSEAFAQSVKILTRSIGEAVSGSKESIDNFYRLGVQYKDAEGKARPVSDVLLDISKEFQGGVVSSQQYALALQLMGRSAEEIFPMLSAGPDQIRELMKETHVFSQELIDKMDEIEKAGMRLEASFSRWTSYAIVGFAELLSTTDAETIRLKEMQSAMQNLLPSDEYKGNNSKEARANAINDRIAALKREEAEREQIATLLKDAAKLEQQVTAEVQRAMEANERYKKSVADQQFKAELKAQEEIFRRRMEIHQQMYNEVKRTIDEAERLINKTQADFDSAANKKIIEDLDNRLSARQEFVKAMGQKMNEEYLRSARGGYDTGLKELQDEYSNTGKLISDTMRNSAYIMESSFAGAFASMRHGFEGMEDVGKHFFEMIGSLGDQILSKLLMNQLIGTAASPGLFGTFGLNANGGYIPGGLGPTHAFASGGFVKGKNPIMGIVGEGEHDEIILPVKNGMADLGGVRKGGGGGVTIVNNNYFNISAMDSRSVAEALHGPGAEAIGNVMIQRINRDPRVRAALQKL